ncbi:hydroxypyruvate isomerase family protein [Actinophytocola xanthii]|uniref:Hydroxypyruvate isomerase n=1 Tax=Actinophytocola xanthii TaxID=1912961 RepID=A0A1Q8BT10_9PSEU|nr:TIM barrel protein [Actinophytocola xanthii]OLF05219.1 hydroxypyruvate isomerase [Actinophytocola xanthii]
MAAENLRFDVNLSILFTELPMLERPAAAARAGFDAVELWWPFGGPVPGDRELDALAAAIDDAGVGLVGLNFDAGDMPSGDRGLLSSRSTSQRFRDNIDVAVGFAGRLGCTVLNALYGNTAEDTDPDLALENLALAVTAARGIGATVVVEAINSHENPRYPLTSAKAVLDVVDLVPGTAFLADLYHLHRMGEDIEELIRTSADRFGHVQIADSPGRGQPGTGEIDWSTVFALLAASPYDGFVGLEYKPVGPSEDSFGWLEEQA